MQTVCRIQLTSPPSLQMQLKYQQKMIIITRMMIIKLIMPLVVGAAFREDNYHHGAGQGQITPIISLQRSFHLRHKNIPLPKDFRLHLAEAGVPPGGEITFRKCQAGGGGAEGDNFLRQGKKRQNGGPILRMILWVSSTIIASYVTRPDVDHSTLIVDILGGPKFMRQIVATA